MKQWLLPSDATTPSELRLEEVEVPQPAAGEVRIRVRAISLNARDQMIVRGVIGREDGVAIVPLSDVAGVVDAVGGDVDGWAVGDRVCTPHVPGWIDGTPIIFGVGAGSAGDPGVAAEWIVVDHTKLVASPANLDDIEASTLQIAGVTAWNALLGALPVQAGDKVLVIGSGGVSLAATQIATTLGADVYAAVRSEAHGAEWNQLGVAGIVDTHDAGWGSRVREISGGVTKVVNTVGPGVINECVAALAPGGEVAVLGLFDFDSGPLDAMTLIGTQGSVRGVAVGSVAMHHALSRFTAEHDLHPVIDSIFDFDDLPAALLKQSGPGIFGKVVIAIR